MSVSEHPSSLKFLPVTTPAAARRRSKVQLLRTQRVLYPGLCLHQHSSSGPVQATPHCRVGLSPGSWRNTKAEALSKKTRKNHAEWTWEIPWCPNHISVGFASDHIWFQGLEFQGLAKRCSSQSFALHPETHHPSCRFDLTRWPYCMGLLLMFPWAYKTKTMQRSMIILKEKREMYFS